MSHYELRAEHHPGEMARNGYRWHVVRRGSLLGLCGQMMSPVGEMQLIEVIDQVRVDGRCPACWTAYEGLTAYV